MPKTDRWTRLVSGLVLAGMVGLTVFALLQFQGIRLQNRVETWLSADDPQAVVLQQFRERFSDRQRLLVSWDGSSLADPRAAEFARRLSGKPRFSDDDDAAVEQPGADVSTGSTETPSRHDGLIEVDDVVSPLDLLLRMTAQDVEPDEAVRRLRGVLIGSPTRTFEAHGEADDVTAELIRAAGGAPIALLTSLSDTGASDPVAAFKSIEAAAVACGIAADSLHLGGDLVTSSALDQEVLNATWNVTDPLHSPPVFLLSGIAGLLLAFVVLRSVKLGFMVLAVAAFTAVVCTALIPMSGRTMNMVVIVMPTMLVVLALSAAIHLANYWKHASSRSDHDADHDADHESSTPGLVADIHSTSADPIRASIQMAWLPCLLASLTTAIGLLSLCISSLQPIRDFGTFSALGTLLSLVAVLVGLPAMMRVFPVRSPAEHSNQRPVWQSLGRFISRHNRSVAVVGLVLFLGCSVGLLKLRTDVRVERNFPPHSRLARDLEFLEGGIGGVVPVEIAVRFNEAAAIETDFIQRLELIRRIAERVREHRAISGAVSMADFQPIVEPPDTDAGLAARMRYSARLRAVEFRIKQTDAAESSRFLAIARPASFDGEAASESLGVETSETPAADEQTPQLPGWNPGDPVDEVWRISAQTFVSAETDYGMLTSELGSVVRHELLKHPAVEAHVTGTVPLFFRAQQALLDSLIRSFGLAFAVIAVAMMFLLRGVWSGILCMLPNLLPVGMVFGLMSWSGQLIDIGTMLTASVALGIAVAEA